MPALPDFDRFFSISEWLNGRLSAHADTFRLIDRTNPTKRIAFDVSGVAALTERTVTLPDVSGVLALAAVAGGFNDGTILYTNTANFAGADVSTAQPFFQAAGDTATLRAATSYLMLGAVHVSTAGATARTASLLYGGAATFTSIGGIYLANAPATDVLGAVSAISFGAATATAVTASIAAATHISAGILGIVRCNAAGTFIPQYQYSAAPGAVSEVHLNSFLLLQPIGSNTVQGLGVS